MKLHILPNIIRHTLTLIILTISVTCYASQQQEVEQYSELTELTSAELIALGNNCFLRNVTDSALVCYSIVLNRHEDDTQEERFLLIRAYNNRGCVALSYLDYQRAYDCFTKAVELSDKYKIDDVKFTAKYNLVKLLSVYNINRFSDRPMPTDLSERYEEVMNDAIKTEDWSVYLSAFIDLAELDSHIDLEKHKIILSDRIPTSVNNLSQARISYHAFGSLQRGKYTDAREWFDKLLNNNDNTDISIERFILMAHIGIAHSYALEHNYAKAIEELEKTESMTLSGQAIEYVVLIYQKLSEYYNKLGNNDKSQFYKIRQLEKIDSLNQNNSIMNILVNDIQQKDRLNHQLAEKHRHQRNMLIIASVVAIVIFAFAIGLLQAYRMVSTRNKSLYEKNHAVMQAEAKERQLRKQYEQIIEKQREENVVAATSAQQAEEQSVALPPKYSKSNLNDEEKQRLIGLIMDVMNDAETICQQDFTLSKLSKLVESNNTYVSQVINEKYDTSFSNLLNIYRVKEVCRRLDNIEQYGNQTIEAIYTSVGFKTRITFAKAFKSEIGLTPSEYLRMAKEKYYQ